MCCIFVADQLLTLDVVIKEGESWRVIVVGDEVTRLWHSEVLEVWTSPIVAAVDQIGFCRRGVLHPIDLAGLRPEVGASSKI